MKTEQEPRSNTKQGGYTLVELMVGLVLSLLTLTLLGQTFITQNHAYDKESKVVQMQQNARMAMLVMTGELHQAGYTPEGIGCIPGADVTGQSFSDGVSENVEEMGVDAFTFQGDIDGDYTTETVRYSWSGTEGDPLMREVWKWNSVTNTWDAAGDPQEVADNIKSLVFTYDAALKADVKMITVLLTASNASGDRNQTLRTKVWARNL